MITTVSSVLNFGLGKGNNTAYLPPKQACWGLTDVISTQVLFATCGQKSTQLLTV